MKVLISAESFLPRSNGVTNSVLRISRYLKANGHDVLVLASGEGPSQVKEIPVRRVPALALKRIAQVDIPRVKVKTLIPIIEEFNPDIIYLASPFLLGEQVRKAGLRLGIAVIANYQTDVSGFSDFYGLNTARSIVEKRLKKIHGGSTLTLAPSTDSIEYLNQLGIENVRYWGRGVDLEQFNPAWRSEKLRKFWGADEQTLVIGFVGRLAPEKQVHKLASIGDVGVLAGKKVLQIVVGDGPIRENLEKLLPSAIFTGHLNGKELSKAVASMDLLITTGENETFCQVIQEAMAAALPVIAPRAGGPKDLIIDGIDGFLYEPGDNLDIRKKVLRAIFDRDQLAQMSEAAFLKVQEKTWDNVCSQLISIFREVLPEDKFPQPQGIHAS